MISFNKFTKLFVLTTVIILSLIAGFNYWVDPSGIFHNKKIDLAVKYLTEGQAVSGLVDYNERLLKKELILYTKTKPETIVLGSSRAMGIRPDFDKNNNTFANFSVSCANFNDDIALFSAYVDRFNGYPNKVVLAVEPWCLNYYRTNTQWKDIEEYYDSGLLKLGLKSDNEINILERINFKIEKIKTLISSSYLRASIKQFFNFKTNSLPKVVDLKYNEQSKILPNGVLEREYRLNNLDLREINANVQKYLDREYITELKEFNELNKSDIIKFIKLIHYLKNNDVYVILYFPPYHPTVYEYIINNNKYKNVINAEKIFLNIAKNENIKTIGSYNPNTCGVEEEDFFDGMHLKDSGYDKVFKNKF